VFGGVEHGGGSGAGGEVDDSGCGDVDIYGGGGGFNFYVVVLFYRGVKGNHVKTKRKLEKDLTQRAQSSEHRGRREEMKRRVKE